MYDEYLNGRIFQLTFGFLFCHLIIGNISGRCIMYSSKDINNITDIVLRKMKDVVSIYLFGSYAKGTARDDSDIDIAILLKKLPDWRERKNVLNQIYNEAGVFNYNVDFLIKSKDSFESEKTLPTLSRVIEREGKLLWTKK